MKYIAIIDRDETDFSRNPVFTLLKLEEVELESAKEKIEESIIRHFGQAGEMQDGCRLTITLPRESLEARVRIYRLFMADDTYENWLAHHKKDSFDKPMDSSISTRATHAAIRQRVNRSSVENFLKLNEQAYSEKSEEAKSRTKEKAYLVAQGMQSSDSPFSKLTVPPIGAKIATFASQQVDRYPSIRECTDVLEVTATETINHHLTRKQRITASPDDQKSVTQSHSESSSAFFQGTTAPSTPYPSAISQSQEVTTTEESKKKDNGKEKNGEPEKLACIVM